MGANSKIEWCDHTFNPWIGCTKVSPGCAHCYAERDMERYGKAKWGAGQPRVRTAASTWTQPLKWDRAAAQFGRRDRVFCASLADVFDPEVPIEWLADLFFLIDRCPHLDWLLLTKRPELIRERCDLASNGNGDLWDFANHMPNVWLGTTVEDQQRADERIPWLLKVPARVRFLSCEPMLGPVDLRAVAWGHSNALHRLDWIIAGGESGPQARPMSLTWALTLRDQAVAAGVPFLFKQWGEWCPSPSDPFGQTVRVGKKYAGRTLDGRTWDEYPKSTGTAP
jgi:protein gp37